MATMATVRPDKTVIEPETNNTIMIKKENIK